MESIRNTIKRWWLPSLLLMVATVSFSMVVPGLFYPDSFQRNDQTLLTRSPTPEPTFPLLTPQPTSLTVGVAPPTVQPAPTRRTAANCTYTWYYWRSQPEAWMTQFIQIGRLEYSKTEALEIMAIRGEELDAAVLTEFFSALLNILKGADSIAIDLNLVTASGWIERNPLGVELSAQARQDGLDLARALSDFNNGVTGPGSCADDPPTPTPVPTDTPTPTLTPTPTSLPTEGGATPSNTPKPKEDDEPTELPPPTDTPKPDRKSVG